MIVFIYSAGEANHIFDRDFKVGGLGSVVVNICLSIF